MGNDKPPLEEHGVNDDSVVQFRLQPTIRAPFIARRLVGSLVSTGPRLRGLDACLLAGETTGVMVMRGSPMTIAVTEPGRRFRVEVTAENGAVARPDGIVGIMLDRLSDRWGQDRDTIWFEIDLIRRHHLTDLPDERLFELLPADGDARNELFERYAGFATAIARRFRSRSHRLDDLEQVAMLGLVQALERFDPDFGVKFTSFSGPWISGLIKRHLRDHAWSMRVPRSLQEGAMEVTKARAELTQVLGREPLLDELAESLHLTTEELQEAILAGDTYSLTSLDAPVAHDADESVGSRLVGDEDPSIRLIEDLPAIEAVLRQLSDREQQVLYLRFFEDLTQSEIASILDMSQVHVSRTLKRSLEQIRRLLAEADAD